MRGRNQIAVVTKYLGKVRAPHYIGERELKDPEQKTTTYSRYRELQPSDRCIPVL